MLISSLSNYDYICLVATYNDLMSGDKQKISQAAHHRGYTAEQLKQASAKIKEKFNSVSSCNLRFTRPLNEFEFEGLGYLLTLYENYERGCMPFPGSVSEQPAQIMDIFSTFRQLKYEADVRQSEKLKSNGRYQHQNKPRISR